MNPRIQRILTAKQQGWVTCVYCDFPIEADDWDVEVDASDDSSQPVRIWHRECFEAFLDEGEEC